jgi:predicted transcriptional regulator
MNRHDDFVSEIKELKKRKLNNAEIAEHLGITKAQVKKFSQDKYDEMENTYDDSMSDYSYSNDDSDIGDIISTMNGYRHS